MKHELTKEQKERFDRLIKAVEKGITYKDAPVFFDIETWLDRRRPNTINGDGVYEANECGTVACIHGHALIEFEKEIGIAAGVGVAGGHPRRNKVARLLGVSDSAYVYLCMPPDDLLHVPVTREHAVEAIKHLKYNGRMSHMVWEAIVNG